MHVALKVDVDTLRGTREGVPALASFFQEQGINATFLFSVGPDHTGRALKRLLRPGFLAKVLRTSVPSHYGWKTLMYGTVLPGPDIGRLARSEMRQVKEAGFEVGLHAYDHVKWQDYVVRRGKDWTRVEFDKGVAAYERTFGEQPAVVGAAGWQINSEVIRLESIYGMRWASDTRGTCAFLPAMNGYQGNCPQLPTTLPTMDELIGRDGMSAESIGDYLVDLVRRQPGQDQIFTLHAELEGMALMPALKAAVLGWKKTGAVLGAVGEQAKTLDTRQLPVCTVEMAKIPGRAGRLAVQGRRINDVDNVQSEPTSKERRV